MSKRLKRCCYCGIAILTLVITLSVAYTSYFDRSISYQEALLVSQNTTYSLDGTRKYFQIALKDQTLKTILVPSTTNCKQATYVKISVHHSLLTGKDIYSFVGCNLNK